MQRYRENRHYLKKIADKGKRERCYLGCRVERRRGVRSGEYLFYCRVLSVEKLYFMWRFLQPGNF